ncbi:Zn-ribbon domain-containing OB-fold protein [Sneathiella sp.]|uniref:Zn-ribbon domain-containing OB-fold protein n=1 Tax=Sneathiella sp. TaxID=1964365 RepID=UPI002633405E|nr:Zn-ribbon domain-containing OB-fold protein [Sneathiella sp.]MDF2368519.1 Zn-ribbon domain-containing OB-fold protein [Sneathiella sp.]
MTGKPIPVANPDTAVFWDACNEKRFLIQSCKSCGENQFYPRAICKNCQSNDLEWQEVSGRGTVKTFTVVRHAPSPAFKADLPYVLALINLDEGVSTMMNVIECDVEDVHIGMDIELTFELRGEQYIPQAKPISKG